MTQVTLPGGLTVNYKYDGLGRRIQRTTSAGANERYVYDGADVLIDLNADWSVATTYLNGAGVDNHLRQTNSSTGVSYFLADHLRSTAGLTDSSGTVVEQLAYDSFGNNGGSTRTRYTYTGRERDPDTGMLYYRARFYDPQVGRFVSEDPIGFAGGNNFYSYVENSPLHFSDPLGLCGEPQSSEQSLTEDQANVVWNALERAKLALERPLCRKYIGEGAYNALRKIWDDRQMFYFHGTMFDSTDKPNRILMAATTPGNLWRSTRITFSYNFFHDPTISETARRYAISPLEQRALILLHEARHVLCPYCGYHEAHEDWNDDIVKYCFK